MYPFGAILEIQKTFYKHVGVYIGDGKVLHNHSVRGEEIVPPHTFSQGNIIMVRPGVVQDPYAFIRRVQSIALNPEPYSWFSNNCDHTVHKAVYGKSWSPQLEFWGGVLALGVISLAVARAR